LAASEWFASANKVAFVKLKSHYIVAAQGCCAMKILLVDDHVLIREAMRSVLQELQSELELLEAGTCRQTMEIVGQHADLDLVLLDLRLPDRDGLDVLTDLRARYPALPVVMLSAFSDRDNVVRALDSGAMGFIPKTAPRDILLSALKLILAGGIYIPAEILAPAQPTHQLPPTKMKRPSPAELGLTGRQVDVLALIMQGKSNKLICRALNLAEPTVKNHVSAILKALDVSNRTEAALAVAALGWELPKVER
jgi:DNA-binding NarL/FixJ family response regulator